MVLASLLVSPAVLETTRLPAARLQTATTCKSDRTAGPASLSRSGNSLDAAADGKSCSTFDDAIATGDTTLDDAIATGDTTLDDAIATGDTTFDDAIATGDTTFDDAIATDGETIDNAANAARWPTTFRGTAT